MKKMFYYSLTILCCLLMTGLYAGVASNKCEKVYLAKKCGTSKMRAAKAKMPADKETTADFIFTNRVLLF